MKYSRLEENSSIWRDGRTHSISWREKAGLPCGIAAVVVAVVIHNVHDVLDILVDVLDILDVLDMLDVLAKSPSLYQVQELRY